MPHLNLDYKYSAKIAIAGMVAVLFAYLMNLHLIGAMLIVTYVMMVVQANVGASIATLRPLIIWVILGTLAALLMILILGASVDIHPSLSWLALCILIATAALVIPISDYARLGLFTALFVFIFGEASHTPFLTSLLRGLYLLIALIIGLAVTYYVFPKKASQLFLDKTHQFVSDNLSLFKKATKSIFHPEDNVEWNAEEVVKQLLVRRDYNQKNLRLLEDIHQEQKWNRLDEYHRFIIIGENRMVTFLCDYIRLVKRIQNNAILLQAKPEMQSLAELVERIIAYWFEIVMKPNAKRERPYQDPKELYHKINSFLAVHRDLLREQNITDLTAFFAFFHLLQTYADRMQATIDTWCGY